jgi:hypothetical protein
MYVLAIEIPLYSSFLEGAKKSNLLVKKIIT